MENTKKDSPDVKQDDAKEKVLDLQELDKVSGGAKECWSVGSVACSNLEAGWSTQSEGCL